MNMKLLGTTLLITGTAIGAGMLALPMITGMVGFPVALIILFCIWALMTYTGLLVLEVNLSLPVRSNSFKSMAHATAGPAASHITWISVALLLYSLTGAYISGDSSLLTLLCSKLFHFDLPHWLASSLFTLLFGTIVWYSTHAVDKFNRLFFTAKGFFLVVLIALLLPKIQLAHLISSPRHSFQVWLMIPIFLTSFGYHTVIPSLTNYLEKDHQTLRRSIVIGTTIPLLAYTLWLISTLGLIPQTGPHSFTTLSQHNSIATLTHIIMQRGKNPWISFSINCFANIAVTTSFLGVALGLFDFNADVFKINDHLSARLKTAAITFAPPLIFSIIYPHGFLIALSAAAIFVTFLEVILPAWMAIQLRKKNKNLAYQAPGGSTLLMMIIILGVCFITACIGSFL